MLDLRVAEWAFLIVQHVSLDALAAGLVLARDIFCIDHLVAAQLAQVLVFEIFFIDHLAAKDDRGLPRSSSNWPLFGSRRFLEGLLPPDSNFELVDHLVVPVDERVVIGSAVGFQLGPHCLFELLEQSQSAFVECVSLLEQRH